MLELLRRVARVRGVGGDPLRPFPEPLHQVATEQMAVHRPLPAVGELGSRDHVLGLEELPKRLHAGVGEGELVLQLLDPFIGHRQGLGQLSDTLLEHADPLEQVLVELLLLLQEHLVGQLGSSDWPETTSSFAWHREQCSAPSGFVAPQV